MAASGLGFVQTFGEKPKKFQIEEGGEFYYIGSEVSHIRALSPLKKKFVLSSLPPLGRHFCRCPLNTK